MEKRFILMLKTILQIGEIYIFIQLMVSLPNQYIGLMM